MSGEATAVAPQLTWLERRVVVLISAKGDILTHFTTDRDEFPSVVTHGRDRIFTLAYTGDLTSLPGMEMTSGIAVAGALYREVDVWRISNATIDTPRPRKRPRRTAKILAFVGRAAK